MPGLRRTQGVIGEGLAGNGGMTVRRNLEYYSLGLRHERVGCVHVVVNITRSYGVIINWFGHRPSQQTEFRLPTTLKVVWHFEIRMEGRGLL